MNHLVSFLLLLCIPVSEMAVAATACPNPEGVTLQVLGSGGPIADDGRASSAYLVWVDGRARVMVDAGGGSFLRFGEAGAGFTDLDLIALSHYHTDHSAALPALLKSGYFSSRERPLTLSGPSAGGPFPGLAEFLNGLIGSEVGAYRYLAGYLDGSNGMALIKPVEIGDSDDFQAVLIDETIRVSAMRVPHGIVPAAAYRVEAGGRSVVFASDQNGSNPRFAEFARGADLLVMHMAIPGSAGAAARKLHATPRQIGLLAAQAEAKTLVLSHFMARSLHDLERHVEEVQSVFQGRIRIAADLACLGP